MKNVKMLQQYLPFTVLKHWASNLETNLTLQQYLPFTVLKHHLRYFYGYDLLSLQQYLPFTVLKHNRNFDIRKPLRLWCYNSTYRLRYWNSNASFAGSVNLSTTLQQYLPFTVLKPTAKVLGIKLKSQLQQYLPFTVLKQSYFRASNAHLSGYNSTYRLRYWNVLTRIIEQREKIVTTVLTVYGIETFR